MIEEAYCSLEVAKLLKEKEFDVATEYVYIGNNNGKIPKSFTTHFVKKRDDVFHCPTHQMALAWLRKKGYYINVCSVFTLEKAWVFSWEGYYKQGVKFWSGGTYFNSIEEATEEALKYVLGRIL